MEKHGKYTSQEQEHIIVDTGTPRGLQGISIGFHRFPSVSIGILAIAQCHGCLPPVIPMEDELEKSEEKPPDFFEL